MSWKSVIDCDLILNAKLVIYPVLIPVVQLLILAVSLNKVFAWTICAKWALTVYKLSNIHLFKDSAANRCWLSIFSVSSYSINCHNTILKFSIKICR